MDDVVLTDSDAGNLPRIQGVGTLIIGHDWPAVRSIACFEPERCKLVPCR